LKQEKKMALRQDVLKKYASKASLRRERSLSQKAEHLEKKSFTCRKSLMMFPMVSIFGAASRDLPELQPMALENACSVEVLDTGDLSQIKSHHQVTSMASFKLCSLLPSGNHGQWESPSSISL
jgi:hypothetical protein